ncbi:NfrA family protein [Pseudidiomarina sp. CB1]|uniref:NfrA family protein n=1 Tax=Pseudidiomarina sp. CB1 TaxID=2972484 RepID=UPI002162FDEC|nr:tetratricopeptide repeat protein [Pseudidiomarina sp. CB1]
MRVLSIVAAMAAMAPQAMGDSIFIGLSDYQEFRTYPYVDKAYRLQQEERYQAALEELDRAIAIAPEHEPFYQYAFELAMLNQDIERARQYLGEIPERNRVALRQRMLRSAMAREVPAAPEMPAFLADLTPTQQLELIQQGLYQLQQEQNKEVAWAWLNALPQELWTPELNLIAARIAADVGAFDAAAQQFSRYAKHAELAPEEIAEFGYVLVEANDEAGAFALAQRYPQAAGGVIRELAYKALGRNDHAGALRYFGWLQKRGYLSANDVKQYYFLLEEDGQLESALALSEQAQTSCLEQVQLLLKMDNTSGARERFVNCSVQENPIVWLSLAERLELYDAVQRTTFTSSALQQQRRQLLMNYYHQQQAWQRQVELLADTAANEAELTYLAMAYDRLGDNRNAETTWLAIWRNYQDPAALEKVTYLLWQRGEAEQTIALLEEGFAKVNLASAPGRVLVSRYVNILYGHPEAIAVERIKLLSRSNADPVDVAELWRLQGNCDEALAALAQVSKERGIRTRAECLIDRDPEAAYEALQLAIGQEPSAGDLRSLASLAERVGDNAAAVGYLQRIPTAERVSSDELAIARLTYLQGDLAAAEAAWQAARQENELDWWLLGVDIAQAQQDDEKTLLLLERADERFDSPLLVEERAPIYRKRNDWPALEALYREAVATYPDNKHFQAELAYSIYERDPLESADYFDRALLGYEENSQVKHLHQAAYAFNYRGDNEKTRHYAAAAIDKMLVSDDPDELQLIKAQRLHRDVESQWDFTVAGWAGDSSRANVGQGIDAQGDYFMQVQAAYAFTESQTSIGGLGAQLSLLQGGESDFFETQELDVGLTWKPSKTFNSVLAVGLRQQLDGDEELKPYLRASVDILSPWSGSKWWEPQSERVWYNSWFVDGIYFPDDDQHAFYSRLESGPVFSLAQSHRQALRFYGFAQGDTSRDLVAIGDADDTRAGLGVGWMSEWFQSDYNGYNLRMELGLEWQHVVSSDFAEDSDNAFIVRFQLYF